MRSREQEQLGQQEQLVQLRRSTARSRRATVKSRKEEQLEQQEQLGANYRAMLMLHAARNALGGQTSNGRLARRQ
eukprot:362469-Lingulodinium_polyedra.AAC.1